MVAILVGILVAGFLVRMAALIYGLPLDVFCDEFVHIVTAFSLLEEMTLRAFSPLSYVPSLMGVLIAPATALWGGLLMLTGAVDGIVGFKEYATLNAVWFIPIGRAISALFGVLFLYILFLITRRVTDFRVALVVTAFASLDFWLVHESQLAHFWMPGVALIALGFYMLLCLAEGGRVKYYIGAIVSLVLGFWMAYFPIVLAPFLALAHLHVPLPKFSRLLYSGVSLVALLGIIGWLNPLSFLKQFGRAIRSGLDVIGVDVFSKFQAPADVATEPIQNALFLLSVVVWDNPLIFALGVCGFALLVWRVGWRTFPAQSTLGLFFVYLLAGMFVWSHPDHRYALPLLLPLYIGVAYSIQYILEKVQTKSDTLRYWVYACVVLVGLYSAYTTFTYVALLRQKDTRLEAREWILKNVPTNSAILTDAYYFDVPKSKQAIEYFAQYLPEALRARDRVAQTLPEGEETSGYFVVNVEYANRLASMGRLPEFPYVVVGFFDPPKRPTMPDVFTLVASFYPRDFGQKIDDLLVSPNNPLSAVYSVSRLGPHIEIYKKRE